MPSPLTYTNREAAEALGCSVGFFRQHIMPEIRVIRRGRRTMILARDVEAWVEKSGETP